MILVSNIKIELDSRRWESNPYEGRASPTSSVGPSANSGTPRHSTLDYADPAGETRTPNQALRGACSIQLSYSGLSVAGEGRVFGLSLSPIQGQRFPYLIFGGGRAMNRHARRHTMWLAPIRVYRPLIKFQFGSEATRAAPPARLSFDPPSSPLLTSSSPHHSVLRPPQKKKKLAVWCRSPLRHPHPHAADTQPEPTELSLYL
jgi:hypothetical protein